MKTVALNIDNTTKPEKLVVDLKQNNLAQGDKLTVNTLLDEKLTFLIVLIALIVLYQRKMDFADKIIKDIFESKKSDEIRDEISREYGIEVSVKSKRSDEDINWHQLSKEKLSGAYGAGEPEYDESMVKEPNPDYKK